MQITPLITILLFLLIISTILITIPSTPSYYNNKGEDMYIKYQSLIETSIINSLGVTPSKEMVDLLLGTMAVESDMGKFRKQLGGPAIGIFQIEPTTLEDMRNNYMKYHDRYKYVMKGDPESNDSYACVIAYIYYKRVGGHIPPGTIGQAYVWKKKYNTWEGKGTIDQYIKQYNKYIGTIKW